jgi:hypothetical protein
VVVQDTVAAGGALTSHCAIDRTRVAPVHMALRQTAVAILAVSCGAVGRSSDEGSGVPEDRP